ncbi:hypothetical protein GALMADRAFT_1163562 [Galerina marginata CBS 339.88]|uniref:SCA7 domain-containing protein n=1 Tax=Galerina marginata (strain CBS 339.88) TaxID=685588 RepID=A0A067TBP7_GALM3|nr:hypothetical protein GALMADRAFT_1163562 [Galerina marginata CBS 339.88]
MPTVQCSTCSEWHHRPCVESSLIKQHKFVCGRCSGYHIDYNRQCGVIDFMGQPCSRSLVCDSHTTDNKRRVKGRSHSFDELLLEWQRAHNPNFVEPVGRETKARKKREFTYDVIYSEVQEVDSEGRLREVIVIQDDPPPPLASSPIHSQSPEV